MFEISLFSPFSLLTFQRDLEIEEKITVSSFYGSLSYRLWEGKKKTKQNNKDIVSSLRVVSVPLFVFLTALSLQLSYCKTDTGCWPFHESILTMCCSPLYFHFHIFLHRKHFGFEAIYVTLI